MKASFRDCDGYWIAVHDTEGVSWYIREHGTKNNNYIKKKNKKATYKVAYTKVKEIMREEVNASKKECLAKGLDFSIKNVTLTAEYIVNVTNIKMPIIKKVLMQLNREGIVSQAINHTSHGRVWTASKYRLRRDKF